MLLDKIRNPHQGSTTRSPRRSPAGHQATERSPRSRWSQGELALTADRRQVPDDGIDDRDWVFVFPEPKHGPAALSEDRVNTSIPFAIGLDLGSPPVPVRFRCGAVHGAPVPETSVEEDDDSPARPYDVATKGKVGKQSAVNAVTVSAGVQFAAHQQFDVGAGGFLSLHLTADLFGRRR